MEGVIYQTGVDSSVKNSKTSEARRIRELEQKVAELSDLIAEKQELIAQAEKMALLGQLVAGIAHEINTPLGALKSNYDLFIRYLVKIKEIVFDPQAPAEIRTNTMLVKLFNNIDKLNEVNNSASERIVQIVNGVRKYARQDESKPSKVDIHEIIESTLTIVHHELKNRIKVIREFKATTPISCYPNKLNQVLLNLIVNAGHAIEGKGEIYIKTYNQNDGVVAEVQDTGKGIPKDKLQRIFEPGYTTKSSGMGLGLSLVQQMIEEHQGKIEVESTVNVGTTFRIILPVQQTK